MMVKTKDGSTWIEDVPVLLLGMQKDAANVGVFDAIMSVTDHSMNYQDLMAASSIGLTVKWFKGQNAQWGGDSLPGDCEDEIELISQAMGYECSIKKDQDTKNECKQLLIDTIQNGIPAICLDRGLNLAVVFGYENEGDIWLVRPYIDACSDSPEWNATVRYSFNDLIPYFIFLKRSRNKVEKLSAIVNGIKTGINNFHRASQISNGAYYKPGIYFYGKEAYDEWINDLLQVNSYNEEEQKSLKFFSWWNCIGLKDRRTAMVSVFRNLAGNPYRTQTTDCYVEAAKLCVQQVRILDKRTKANTYDSSFLQWMNQISNEISSLKSLLKIENELYKLLSSITDYTDI